MRRRAERRPRGSRRGAPSARFAGADLCLRFEPRPGRLTERLVRVRRCWAGLGRHCAIRPQSRLRRRLVSTCRRGDSPSPDAKAPSLCPSGPDGAAWVAAVCEKQMVSRWADASCASPRSAAGSQLGGLLWARVGWLHCRWRWRLDWPRVTQGPGRLSGAALPFRSGSRPAVELRRVGCDALLATERSCESLSGGAMRGAPRGRPYWAGPRLGAARGLRL